MNIAATQFSLENNALEIYLSGCDGSCRGCHNPELWDYSVGKCWKDEINKIVTKINEFNLVINHVWILGGEPLLQDNSKLVDMLARLQGTSKKIWLFTRFEYDEIPKEILLMCDYVKCGHYDACQRTNKNIQYGVRLASANQYIIDVKSGRRKL